MTLTEERRNEIAHRYVLHGATQRPLASLEEATCAIEKMMPNWTHKLVVAYVRDSLHTAFANVMPSHTFEQQIPKDSTEALSWEFFLELEFEKGVKIGELNKRQAGNTGKEIGISTSEAFEFKKLVATEIFNRCFQKTQPEVGPLRTLKG